MKYHLSSDYFCSAVVTYTRIIFYLLFDVGFLISLT